jgi:hypothetical protein
MMRTEDLIETLARNAAPVRPLAKPMRRASLWLFVAVAVVATVFLILGPRPDLAKKMSETPYLLEWFASLATGWAAAVAAFHLSLPDRSRRWLLLPLAPAVLWLSSIGYGCFDDWVRLGPDGLSIGTSWACFQTILLVSLPLTALQLVMLRHAARLRPIETLATGSLAAAAFSAAGLTLFHHLDTALMVLIWHLGSIVLVVAFWSLGARRIFHWLEPASPVSR